MRNLFLTLAVALGAIAWVAADETKKGSETGEVVDMACYMGHGASGKAHAKCGQACLLGGMPAGLLKSDGTVTLLLSNHGNAKSEKAMKSLAKLAGDQVMVSGDMVNRGGMNAIVVESVAKK